MKSCFLNGLFAVPSLSCLLAIAPSLNGQMQDRRPVLWAMPPDSNNGHLPFSLVYWAADYPAAQRDHKATPMTWENAILKMQADYRATGGIPDEFVIESWIGVPPHAVPENQLATFMHSVVSFERGLEGERQGRAPGASIPGSN